MQEKVDSVATFRFQSFAAIQIKLARRKRVVRRSDSYSKDFGLYRTELEFAGQVHVYHQKNKQGGH